jgi:hypothetical protein
MTLKEHPARHRYRPEFAGRLHTIERPAPTSNANAFDGVIDTVGGEVVADALALL